MRAKSFDASALFGPASIRRQRAPMSALPSNSRAQAEHYEAT